MYLSSRRKTNNLPDDLVELLEKIEKGPNKQRAKRELTNGVVQPDGKGGYCIDMDNYEVQDLVVVINLV